MELRGNGISPQLRNKYLMNERCKDHGLKINQQLLTNDWSSACDFIRRLSANVINNKCVIKPARGVGKSLLILLQLSNFS